MDKKDERRSHKHRRRRWCLECSKKHAIPLAGLLPDKSFSLVGEPVFCTIHCAAAYGLRVALNRAGFCDEHWVWYDQTYGGRCPHCEATACEGR